MKIDTLREFISFSTHLNVSTVAQEMHISQSSLSRHLLDMEKELGIKLVSRDGRKTYLTKAGRVFLDNIIPLVQGYDFAVDAAHRAGEEIEERLIIQEFPVRNASSMLLYDCMVAFKKQHRNCTIDFLPLQRSVPEEALSKGRLDIAQVVIADNADYVIERYEEAGLDTITLINERALVWMHNSNPLAQRENLTLDDLVTETFCVAIGSTYDPMIDVIRQMYHYSGTKPRIRSVGVESMAEFFLFAGDYENCIYLVTPQYMGDSRLLAHDDWVFKEIDDERAMVSTCLLFDADSKNKMVRDFVGLIMDSVQP